MHPLRQHYSISEIIFFSELINHNPLFTLPSLRGELRRHCCATILHSPHTGARLRKVADKPNTLQSDRSFIHSLLLCHCLAMPCTSISIYLPACLSRPPSPSHFHSYYALFCFHAGSVGDGVIDGGMILCCNNNRRGRSRRQHP